MTNVIELAQKFVQYRSHSPQLFPVFSYLKTYLEADGFNVRLFDLENDNHAKTPGLFASMGQGGKHLLFAGHLDIAAPQAEEEWRYSPFGGTVDDGLLYARGICDMKGAVAGFISACESLTKEGGLPGRVSLLLSGDEEECGGHSVQKMLEQLTAEGEKFDFCIFGSPSNPKRLGEAIKIGARGSLWFEIKSFGRSGHPAYHAASQNPLHNLLDLLNKLKATALDNGNENFSPSTLQIMSLRSENGLYSNFPMTATAMVQILYNNNHRPENIVSWMQRNVSFAKGEFELKYEKDRNIYYNTPEREMSLLKEVIERASGIIPSCGTEGSSTSAGFISSYCPVIEFGLTNALVHRMNEAAKVEDIYLLEVIYRDFIKNYF